jgi:cysteine desulfurase / selenocysteine lyase
MTPESVRALFPALNNFVWLNAAASSPLATPVHEAFVAHQNECLRQGDIGWSQWIAHKETLRGRLAHYVQCESRELAFVPSTSFGFNVIGQLLKARGIREVLTLDQEFPSTTLPLLHQGLTLRVVNARPDNTYRVEDLAAACGPETRAVALSLVQYASGFRIDIEALAQWCAEKKLVLILNGAQALGHIPVYLKKWGASFFVSTSHKWFFGGYGVGNLFISSHWLEQPLPQGGWLSVEPSQMFQPFVTARQEATDEGFLAKGFEARKDASSLEVGGGVWSSFQTFGAALALHEQLPPGAVLQHNVALQLHLRQGLRRRGFTPNIPDETAHLSGICVVPFAKPAAEVVGLLMQEKRIATTARGVGVRISTHIFNSHSDVEALFEALDSLHLVAAPHG